MSDRIDEYCRRRGLKLLDRLDAANRNKDGEIHLVYGAGGVSVLKGHHRKESYWAERDCYIRLRECDIHEVNGFQVPEFLGHDEELLVIEMSLVSPPFIVDFASAHLDEPPDWIEDEAHTFYDFVFAKFGDRTDQVMALHHELFQRAGVYLCDLHPDNIKFDDPPASPRVEE